MEIDYTHNLGKSSVKFLISELQKIVDENPHINFHKVGVSLSEEYNMNHVELQQWEHNGKKRINIDIY